MFKAGIAGFPYYLGINSLEQVATRAERVCVLNILAGEPRVFRRQRRVRHVAGKAGTDVANADR